MHFSLKTSGIAGKDIPHNGSISFVVPVTVTPMKKIVVTGYDTDGVQLFVRSKELTTPFAIEANYMYNIPPIKI